MRKSRLAALLAVVLVPAVALAVVVKKDSIHMFTSGIQLGATGTLLDDSYATGATTLDIASVTAATCLDTTLSSAVTGAAVGDTCTLAAPASPTANLSFTCFVSAADTVKIRACNPTAGNIDPASGSYAARVFDP